MISKEIRIPGYDLEDVLGKGGAAVVYRARQKSFGREVALKVLNPESEDAAAFSQRFLRESKIVANLHHSHIVQVYDVGQHDNYCYISMEYLHLADLGKKIRAGIPLKETVTMIKQLASALDFAHRKHIVHRDIKPENILFREDNAAVLTDFGIAKELQSHSELTQTGLVIGTPKYMSPEQIRGEEVDHRADLYALGVVFYRCLTNFVPFNGKDVLATAYLQNHEPVPNLPTQVACFQSIINRMLEKRPEDRFQRGNDIIAALEALDGREYDGELTNLDVAAANKHAPPTVTSVPSGSHSAAGQSAAERSSGKIKQTQKAADVTLFHAKPKSPSPSDKTVVRSRIEPSISEQIYPSDYLDVPELDDLDADATLKGDPEGIDAKPILTAGRIVVMFAVISAVVVLVTNPVTGKSAKSTWPDYFSSLLQKGLVLLGAQSKPEALNPKDFTSEEVKHTEPESVAKEMVGPAVVEPQLPVETVLEVSTASWGVEDAFSTAEPPNAPELDQSTMESGVANVDSVATPVEMPDANLDASVEEPMIEPEPEVKAPTQEERIALYLSDAEADFASGRLRQPLEGNAYDKYQQVLFLDPNNPAAKEGIRNIANAYLTQANTAISEKNFDAVETLIGQAQAIAPDNPNIQRTRSKLAEAIAAEQARIEMEKAKAIEQLIAQLILAAEEDEQAGRVRSPLGDNALEKYQRVLELDPDNTLAIKKLIEYGR